MIPLNQIQVPEPCGEDWGGMDGDARRRFCAGCGCHVHDLSAMTARAAQDLLDRANGRICVRFQTRPDGMMLTQDAPPAGRMLWPRRLSAAVSWTLALVVAGLGLTTTARAADTSPHKGPHAAPKAPLVAPVSKRPRVTLGKIVVPRRTVGHTIGVISLPRAIPPPPTTMGVPRMAPVTPRPTKK